MSGIKRLRLAEGEAILQDGPKTSKFIMPNPQKDMSGFWHKVEQSADTMGGDVKAPRKSNPLDLSRSNDAMDGYMDHTPPPVSNIRPIRGEHQPPKDNKKGSM